MSRLPSSMMGGRRSRQQPTQPEIIETNPMRDVRTIYWSCRWLDGWVGAYVQTNWKLNDTLGLSNIGNPAEPQMHWALRIGSYLYELLTDENMNIRWRYVDEARFESWTSAIPDRAVGETSATDTELAFMGKLTDYLLSVCS
ncbi:hypothetical protein N7452_006195 [Penicillium brevicompactum]|uniref:Uncharacterized protein n=1 Tax=Penicillium brevicompactum TaxID=5074 RepID=A0A9W9QK24_PENBR|nr:hypothetical protein N7452_006195 [Penicillium brevicompactum]